ncbi:hypothetical protein ACRAWF_44390 [Streptomyces sp. L7]
MGAAVREFAAKDGDGWLTSAALKKAHGAWADQVKNLMDRLGAEKRRAAERERGADEYGSGGGVDVAAAVLAGHVLRLG